MFIPDRRLCGLDAVASTPGFPWYTTTRSARYVAMMKSCSTTKAVFLACMMKRLMTLAQLIRCSESRYADGSSIRYTSAGVPSARTMASRWSSPPDRVCTPLSMMLSMTRGFMQSETNWGCT
mmetsp:Transcript_36848/g.75173  ORF Transcript_36848/g.75173 Transcript_36848/m.75173 type:complete len:122 (+) Transcript_36848:629-994(+)